MSLSENLDFLQNVFNIEWSSTFPKTDVEIAAFDWLTRLFISFKIFFSETRRWMKLIQVCSSRCINCGVFFRSDKNSGCLWQHIFHRLTMRKVKLTIVSDSVGIFGFCVYRNVYRVVLYVSYGLCPNR